tara:strand:+ start:487 stop:1128 length:642 start_codon:yes stop_codon:yes gene_type:complete
MSSFKVNELSSLDYDKDTMTASIAESIGPGKYMLEKFSPNQKNTYMNTALSQKNVNFTPGFGVSIDNTEKYVPAKVSRHAGDCNQLFTRPFLTIPYLGKGEHNVDSETNLLSGDNSRNTKTCNNLSGLDMTNYHMVPLVKNIKDNIQNPIHYIPEMNEACWPRGGLDTNQFVLDEDYFGRCLDKNVAANSNQTVNEVLYKHKNYPCNIPKDLN